MAQYLITGGPQLNVGAELIFWLGGPPCEGPTVSITSGAGFGPEPGPACTSCGYGRIPCTHG